MPCVVLVLLCVCADLIFTLDVVPSTLHQTPILLHIFKRDWQRMLMLQCGFRVNEITYLTCVWGGGGDIEIYDEKIKIHVSRSKGNQTAEHDEESENSKNTYTQRERERERDEHTRTQT